MSAAFVLAKTIKAIDNRAGSGLVWGGFYSQLVCYYRGCLIYIRKVNSELS